MMEQRDEISICDLCGKQFWFSKGVIYYIDKEPKLLCPECVEAREMEATKSDFELFDELWWMSPSPAVYCSKRDVILHRSCPVNCENQGLNETVHLTPRECFECDEMIRNGGICDPV